MTSGKAIVPKETFILGEDYINLGTKMGSVSCRFEIAVGDGSCVTSERFTSGANGRIALESTTENKSFRDLIKKCGRLVDEDGYYAIRVDSERSNEDADSYVFVILPKQTSATKAPEPKSEPVPAQPKRSPLVAPAEQNLNLLLEGVPGTGKTFEFGKICDGLNVHPSRRFVLNCHPSTQYEDVIEGLRPESVNPKEKKWECLDGKVAETPDNGWHVVDGVFLRACAAALAKPAEKVALLLDELNRANVPRILGDLLTVLERSKRVDFANPKWKEGDWESRAVTLPLSGRKFAVPKNLIVVATMNTVDHSVSPLDQALLRRFWRVRLEPMGCAGADEETPEQLEQLKKTLQLESAPLEKAAAHYRQLNLALRDALGPDGMIGHSYLTDMKQLCIDLKEPAQQAAAIKNVWSYSVAPQVIAAVVAAGCERWFLPPKTEEQQDKKEKDKVQKLKDALAACGGIHLEFTGEGGTRALRLKAN